MSDKPSIDQQAAKDLGIPPDSVKNSRLDWNNNPQMKAVLSIQINDRIREKQQSLETIEPEALKQAQAEIKAMRQIHALITAIQS